MLYLMTRLQQSQSELLYHTRFTTSTYFVLFFGSSLESTNRIILQVNDVAAILPRNKLKIS